MKLNAIRLETFLAERGMTKAALANRSEISRQSLSTIIRRGTCEPRTLGKLAKALNVPVEELLEAV